MKALLPALFLSLLACPLFAQAPDGERRGRGGRFLDRLMERDADGDGLLSIEEIPERMAERFDEMDENGDGFLSREELENLRGRFGRGGGRGERSRRMDPQAMLDRFDADGDRRLSAEEFRAPAELFARVDLDSDGYLTITELTAMAEQGGQRGGQERAPMQPSEALALLGLTREDIETQAEALFITLDGDEDGILSRRELFTGIATPEDEGQPRNRGRARGLLPLLDPERTGELDLTTFVAACRKLAETPDATPEDAPTPEKTPEAPKPAEKSPAEKKPAEQKPTEEGGLSEDWI